MCFFCSFCGEDGALFISRKGAKLAKAVGVLCVFCMFLSAALSQRLRVLITLRLLLSFVSFVVKMCVVYFSQRRRVRGDYGFAVLVLCVLRLRFRRGGVY